MTLTVKHAFVSTKAVGNDPSKIYSDSWNAAHALTGTADATQLNANVVQAVVNDTNIQGSISAQTLTFSWGGTLGPARLNSNVVQSITNDTNITGSITSQNLTLGWTGALSVGRGGTGQATASAGFDALSPTIARGDLIARGSSSNSRLALGTSGYALVSNGTDPAWTGFVQSGTGAVTRTWNSKSADIIHVADFGAVGDGVTDDTAAITNAIAATPAGGRLSLGPKSYLVTGSGSAIFTLTQAITIEGHGIEGGTAFVLGSGVPTTRDLFSISPASGVLLRGVTFKNFTITAATPVGRHALHFDTSGFTNTQIADTLIERVCFLPNASAGGNSIYINNGNGFNNGAGGVGATGNLTGGTYNLTVRNCLIEGPISILYGGDTIRFESNLISGAACSVSVNQVSGAGNLQWVGNNCSLGGGLSITQAIKPVISHNEFEQQTASTQKGNTLATNAATAAGSNVLNFASVPASIVKGLLVSDVTNGAAIPSGASVVSTTATTVVISSNATGSGVASGDVISFGGVIIDINGNVGSVKGAVIRDNEIQCVAAVNNSPLLRFDNANDCVFDGNHFGVPTAYSPVLITPNAARTRIGNGNYFPGLSVSQYVQDGSPTTSYPYKTEIFGSTGPSTIAAGSTNYVTPGLLNATESLVYLPFATAGIIKNLSVYSQGAPGAGQTYTYTLRDALADTAVTCQISGAASNSASDATHAAAVSASDRWSLKVVSSAGAAATNVTFSFEHHSFT